MFVRYFIPHQTNDYTPHFFREKSVVVLSAVIGILFFITFLQVALITQTNLLASVIPSVLIDLTNTDRRSEQKSFLVISPLLQKAAEAKARDMAAKGYFAHTSPEGLTPWHWFETAGYVFSYAGENLAVNFSDSRDVNNAWMNSPGHRANILNKNFTEIGIAAAKGFYQGQETIFVVQMFGRPAPRGVGRTNISRVKGALRSNIIIEDPEFIAVRNSAAPITDANENDTVTQAPRRVSLFELIISAPKTASFYAYSLLAGLIGLALILLICIEMKHQHPLHIVYGFLLLVIIGSALTIQSMLFFSGLLII